MQIIDLVPDLKPTILAAREMRDANNTLARFLPYHETMSISYRLGRRKRADQTVPVRSLDAPATPIVRPGVVDVQGDLPAVAPIIEMTEDDLTRQMVMAKRLAGIEVDWLPMVNNAAAEVAVTVDNTFELMRGQVLSTLKLALTAEDGVVHDVDFGAAPTQVTTVTTPWSASTGADPFGDLEAAVTAYLDRAGFTPGVILTTAKVKRRLLQTLQLRYPQQPQNPASLSAYLDANDLPQIYTYDRTMTAPDGTKIRVYPEGTMTLLPGEGEQVGKTELGVTQEAVNQVQRLQPNGRTALDSHEAAGLTIVTLGRENPVQRSVKAAAIGMPVLHEVEGISVVKGIFG